MLNTFLYYISDLNNKFKLDMSAVKLLFVVFANFIVFGNGEEGACIE